MVSAEASAGDSGLDRPLVKVLGDRTAKALASQLELQSVGDLLRHYPRRYAERGELTELRRLEEGEHVTVLAQIQRVNVKRMRNRRGSLLEVVVTDGTSATLTLTFFNQEWRGRELRAGRRGLFSGKVGAFRGVRQLSHPDYLLLPEASAGEASGTGAEAPEDSAEALNAFAAEVIPVYPATGSLASWRIAQCVGIALDTLGEVEDPLPDALRARYGLPDLRTALHHIHRPAKRADARTAAHRFKWEEALVLQTVLAQRRAAVRAQPATPRRPKPGGLLERFDAVLPFTLTAGQREVESEILADLAGTSPMNRLLQGDVGSGKTVVALRAMLAVIDAGGQAALLAPTEVLAQQHARSMSALLGPLARRGELDGDPDGTRLVLLTGSAKMPARRRVLLDAASGDAGIVIGTHALLEDPVDFFDLGLVVIDEQHRFGVEQRDALRAKADTPPHVLVMTATPIPRTVAMTVFGDLDVSTLRELPAGRQPVQSTVVPIGTQPSWFDRVWQRVREEVAAGHRAYVVCPRIGDASERPPAGDEPAPPDDRGHPEEADELELPLEDGAADRRPPAAVVEVAEALRSGQLAGLRIDVLHGRLPAEEKEAVMRRFATGEADVLVATTVIEVGVDVPEATVMVILDADRFGISQLHQLRGRIGRGGEAGLCLLVTELPPAAPPAERLAAVAATTDGFQLAQVDLEHRREGDVLGAAQSGRRSSLRLLSVIRDGDLIAEARSEALQLVGADPELGGHPGLARAVESVVETERAEYLTRA